MDIEIGAEAKDKRLNQLVAITVVVLSIFMGLGNVKDGNIVQNMQQAQSDSVYTWGEYQATRTKLHIDEVALTQAKFVGAQGAAEVARLTAEIAKYKAESPALAAKAKGFSDQYDAFNVHDDQFDASEAFLDIAISISAVAALTEIMPALFVAWVFGAGGIVMGLAGFLGWSLHSDLMAKLLS